MLLPTLGDNKALSDYSIPSDCDSGRSQIEARKYREAKVAVENGTATRTGTMHGKW